MNNSQLKWAKRFKWISLAEGLSFLLLLGIAMPLKYGFDMPLAVKYLGWVHGALFVVYIYVVYLYFPPSLSESVSSRPATAYL